MSDNLKYKEYIGVVNYSAESDVFYGNVLGINDTVTFEGKSTKELKEAFKDSIEDYIETCKALGKSPEKSYKGAFNVRVGVDLHKKAAITASRYKISLNEFVKKAIDLAIRNENQLFSK